jgi:hypothetical protein
LSEVFAPAQWAAGAERRPSLAVRASRPVHWLGDPHPPVTGSPCCPTTSAIALSRATTAAKLDSDWNCVTMREKAATRVVNAIAD